MLITAPCVVTLTWRLQDTLGNLIDELSESVDFYFGGDDLLSKVEEALQGQAVGFEIDLQLEPEHAFGDYDPALVFFEARSVFPEQIEPGMQFDGVPPGAVTTGLPAGAVYNVTEVYPEHVVLDGNHPLAGIALRLHMVVRDVREASADEIEARSVGAPVFTVMNTARPGSTLH